ncbi:MAG TPA: flagellin, partial [Stellaceae bacterium]|nr:flagellin [Stellaceae bacterium]
QINNATGQTGIVASVDANNHLVLTQSQGDNISIKSVSLAGGSLAAGGTTLGGAGSTSALVQGVTTLQSTQSFGLNESGVGAGNAGLAVTSSLSALSAVNVSTQAGATAALNVVSFALQQLENVGGQLGAVQQELQATVSNLQSTSTNITAARGVVQDANIPQVTTQLTQQEILQQAGVSALAQSSTLQQSFLKLLQ